MRNRIAIVLVAACMLLLQGCASKMKDIALQDYKIEHISPEGMRGVNVTLALTVYNPSAQVTLSEISGTVFRKGTEFATFTAGDITLHRKCTETYPLEASLRLGKDISLFDLMGLATDHDPEDFTVSLHAHASLRSGLGKDLDFKEVPF